MNLTSFSSSTKDHLRLQGANTACNRRTSGINSYGFSEFAFSAKYEESCCKKCLAAYKRELENKK
jgi:hypothetical protein